MAPTKSRNAIFDAMKNLSAYVTTGDRIILHFELNGARMGTCTAFARDRLIEGQVIGTVPIDEISVVRNGEDIWKRNYRTQGIKRLPKSGTFQFSFFSESRPYHPGDNPRGWRSWYGTLLVTWC